MKSEQKIASNSDVYAQVEQVMSNDTRRLKALATLRSADAFVDGVIWISNEIKSLFKSPAAKASVGHKLAA